VQEIVLIDSRYRRAELYQRRGSGWTRIISERSGVVSLSSVGIGISMSDLYQGLTVAEDTRTAEP